MCEEFSRLLKNHIAISVHMSTQHWDDDFNVQQSDQRNVENGVGEVAPLVFNEAAQEEH